MEFPLILNRSLELGQWRKLEFPNFVAGVGTVDTVGRKTTSYMIPVSQKLRQDLRSHGIASNLHGVKELVGPSLTVAFTFADLAEEDQDEDNGFLSIPQQGFIRIENLDKLTSSIVERKGLDVKIRLDMGNIVNNEEDNYICINPLYTSSKYIFPVTGKGAQNRRLNVDTTTQDAMMFEGNWSDADWEVTLSLRLICSPMGGLGPEIPFYLSNANKMLAKEDLTIIAENGSEIKAHRNLLAAHSSVFRAMFQQDMMEALELKEMSEESVRAFLEFLYTRKLTSADDNPLVCVDLLEAGHKYDIQPMRNRMKLILLEKPDKWYTPESVLRLIIFLKNNRAKLNDDSTIAYYSVFHDDSMLEDLQYRVDLLLQSMEIAVRNLATFRKLCEEKEMTESQLLIYLDATKY